MGDKRSVNRKSRVTRKTEVKAPRQPMSRRGRMALAVVAGLGLGLGVCAQMWSDAGNGIARADAIPLAITPTGAAATAPQRPVEAVAAAPTRESDVVPPEALDLSRAKVVDGRYVIDLADGRRVTLTLLPALQQRAEQVMSKYQVPVGALVAVDPRTGAVLALADHSVETPGRHLALEATQPAASVFKVITSTALVEGKGVSPNEKVCYHGGMHGIGKEHIVDNPRYDTACVTLTRALGKSINPVFAKLADRKLERAELQGWAERFGFGAKIPFALPVQPSRAELPTERVKYAASAAGFYGTKLSPLHAALFVAALGNEGRMMEPHLVDRVERGGVTIFQAHPQELRRIATAETAHAVARMMVATTTEGTAAKYFRKADPALDGIAIGGKTGSLSSTDGGVRHHNSWFVGLAPVDAPEIAVAALVVNSGAWRIKGTHLGRAALESFFKAKKSAPARSPQAADAH